MAVNISRSMNAELGEGVTDGVVKKVPMNRSNVTDRGYLEDRMRMSWRFGFEDDPVPFDPTTGRPARRAHEDHLR